MHSRNNDWSIMIAQGKLELVLLESQLEVLLKIVFEESQ